MMKNLQELHDQMHHALLFDIKEVRGMTGQKIRQILNTLASEATVYMEAGLYCGLSFTSAMYKNTNIELAIAIDSWAEFTNHGRINPRLEFLDACEKFYPKGVPLSLIESDHWKVTQLPPLPAYTIGESSMGSTYPAKPDLFYYDGAHDEQSQMRALTHFGPMCAEEFTFCCDDWNWEQVRRGTKRGLDWFTVVDEWEKILPFAPGRKDTTDVDWWNGFYVARLKQK